MDDLLDLDEALLDTLPDDDRDLPGLAAAVERFIMLARSAAPGCDPPGGDDRVDPAPMDDLWTAEEWDALVTEVLGADGGTPGDPASTSAIPPSDHGRATGEPAVGEPAACPDAVPPPSGRPVTEQVGGGAARGDHRPKPAHHARSDYLLRTLLRVASPPAR